MTTLMTVIGLASLWIVLYMVYMLLGMREARKMFEMEMKIRNCGSELNDGSIQAAIELSRIKTRAVCGNKDCVKYVNGLCTMDCIGIGSDGKCEQFETRSAK